MIKSKYKRVLSLVFIIFLLPIFAFAHEGFLPQGFVNDFAQMLSPESRASIQEDLQNFEKQTSAEITLVTLPSLQGETIEGRAVDIFEEWGIGKKDKDNGILLLIAKEEREARIEVGYGLEPIITDGRAGRIIRDAIGVNFRGEKYDEGIAMAIDDLKNYIIKGEPESAQDQLRSTMKDIVLQFFETPFGLFSFSFILLYVFSFLARSKQIWGGGVFGGFAGIFLSWLFASIVGAFILVPVLGGAGLLLDMVLSRNYQTRKSKGLPTGFWGSGGGFGGGSGRGGGFGGFGGGSSGGGGTSGRW